MGDDNSSSQADNGDNRSMVDAPSVDISENNQSNVADKQGRIRNPAWFKPGQSGNPKGRPKGQSLKEYDRAKFALMSPEEKEDFLAKISADLRYRMAEGNPHQTVNTDLGGEVILKIAKEISDKNETSSRPEPNSEGSASLPSN